MSEAKHTPEPWYVAIDEDRLDRARVISTTDRDSNHMLPIAEAETGYDEPFEGEQAANFERIVACVNACTGIPTEQLEAGCVGKLIELAGEMAYLACNSSGVDGWHLNGALAPWREFDFVDPFIEVVDNLQKDTNK